MVTLFVALHEQGELVRGLVRGLFVSPIRTRSACSRTRSQPYTNKVGVVRGSTRTRLVSFMNKVVVHELVGVVYGCSC